MIQQQQTQMAIQAQKDAQQAWGKEQVIWTLRAKASTMIALA